MKPVQNEENCSSTQKNNKRKWESWRLLVSPECFVGRMFVTSALDHDFWTRTHSKSSKVSKDSDCSLVSDKNFSEILPSKGLTTGPGEVGQGGPKLLHLWRHSKKIRTRNKSADWKTWRIFWAFEQLSTTLALELWARKRYIVRQLSKC